MYKNASYGWTSQRTVATRSTRPAFPARDASFDRLVGASLLAGEVTMMLRGLTKRGVGIGSAVRGVRRKYQSMGQHGVN